MGSWEQSSIPPGLSVASAQGLLDALPAQIAVLDGDGVVLTVNAAWRRFVDVRGGTDPTYGIGQPYWHIVPGADEYLIANLRAVLAGTQPVFQVEYPHGPADDRLWFAMTVTPLDLDDGRGAVVMHVDITERRQAELRARREAETLAVESAAEIGVREQKLHDFAAAASDWFWEADRSLALVSITGRFAEDTGLAVVDIVGRHYTDLPGIDLDEPVWGQLREAALARRPFRDAIYRYRHPDGRTRHFCISGLPVYAPDGTYLGYRGTGQDITETVEAEQRAGRTERLLAEALAVFPGGFALWDADGRLLRVNDAFREPFPKLGRFIQLGRTYAEIMWQCEMDGECIPEEVALLQALRPGGPAMADGPVERRLADGRWLQVRAQAGAHGGTVVLWADITELKEREEGLADQRALLHSTLEAMFEGVAVFDSGQGLLVGNDRLAELLDLPERLVRPGAALDAILARLAETGGLGDGPAEERVASWRAHLIGDVGGEALLTPADRIIEVRHRQMGDGRLIMVVRDVTARRRADAALRETAWHLQERLKESRCLYEISELWNADGVTVPEACRQTAALLPLGFQHPERTVARLQVDGMTAESAGFSVLDHKLEGPIRIGREIVGRLEIYTRHGGSGEERQGPVFLDEERKLAATIADEIARSIGRRRTDEALRRSEQRLRDAVAAISEGFAYFDADDRLVLWNDRFEGDMTMPGGVLRAGVTFEELCRGWIAIGVMPPLGNAVDDWLAWRLDQHRNPGPPFEQHAGNGRIYLIHERRTADGGLVFLRTDITDLKESEARMQQAQRLESLGTLAGGIAHDFNNALVPILTLTELTRNTLPPDGPAARNLDKVLAAARRSRDLVRQILAFSRKEETRRQPLDPARWLAEAMPLLRAGLPTTIRIRVDVARTLPEIEADDGQLTQVLTNLVTNAAHAFDRGQGTIAVSLALADLPAVLDQTYPDLVGRPLLCLSVSDNGMGMTATTLARMFEPFFTTKPVGEGTGLGLPIVHGVVRAHGGAIDVASERGAGTRVDVYLPPINPELT